MMSTVAKRKTNNHIEASNTVNKTSEGNGTDFSPPSSFALLSTSHKAESDELIGYGLTASCLS